MARPRASPPVGLPATPVKEKPRYRGVKSLPGQGNLSRVVLAPRHPAVRGVEAPLAGNGPDNTRVRVARLVQTIRVLVGRTLGGP
jgi:hypothetical protein